MVEGNATVSVGGEERPVEPGSIVFVAARVEHRFHPIAEDLTLLVFFGPAETLAPDRQAPLAAPYA